MEKSNKIKNTSITDHYQLENVYMFKSFMSV